MFLNPINKLYLKNISIFLLMIFLLSFIDLANSEDCRFRDLTVSKYNRLIRVDNFAPTCYQKPICKHFKINSVVLSVDKSMPYLGSPNCCFFFEILYPETYYNSTLKYKPKLVAHISNLTILEGNDWIAIFSGDHQNPKLERNITSKTRNNYDPIYITGNKVNVELNKDRNFRSIFEIVVNTYYDGDTKLCTDESRYFRCGSTNTSYCIDKKFVCDHYPHCVDGEDEAIDCEEYEIIKTFEKYDKKTVLIIFMVLIGMISTVLLLVSLLCFFRNKDKMSETFLSIFGNTKNNEKETQYALLDYDQNDELVKHRPSAVDEYFHRQNVDDN